MPTNPPTDLLSLLSTVFQPHPWHGISPQSPDDPGLFHAFVEIIPTDTVKYELHKPSGHLILDRPQRLSSLCPTPYGFIPQTYCGDRTGARCAERTRAAQPIRGDGDPLDICILTEKHFSQGQFIARVRPIGGLRMVDHDEADDKIIAVLDADPVFGHLRDLDECPPALIQRIQHYFLTYKAAPGAQQPVHIAEIYSSDEALEVIALSRADYQETFGDPAQRLTDIIASLTTAAAKRSAP
jgi:inorganic pyrophosphatase